MGCHISKMYMVWNGYIHHLAFLFPVRILPASEHARIGGGKGRQTAVYFLIQQISWTITPFTQISHHTTVGAEGSRDLSYLEWWPKLSSDTREFTFFKSVHGTKIIKSDHNSVALVNIESALMADLFFLP
jgi:hypothetical protein